MAPAAASLSCLSCDSRLPVCRSRCDYNCSLKVATCFYSDGGAAARSLSAAPLARPAARGVHAGYGRAAAGTQQPRGMPCPGPRPPPMTAHPPMGRQDGYTSGRRNARVPSRTNISLRDRLRGVGSDAGHRHTLI